MADQKSEPDETPVSTKPSLVNRLLNAIEVAGNKLPDPAVLFLIFLVGTWVLSALLAPIEFSAIDPRTDEPIRVLNQLTGASLAAFMANMVSVFVNFHPLGVVLVALLGVGVAEHTGFINAGLKALLSFTPKMLLTPMLIFVAILSHTAADAGYVLVIPLGAVIFYAAGRHPLAGIAAAFAGVSGGFSANPAISGIDPLLQGLTQAAAQIIDPDLLVNPLCNWFFMAASSLLVVGVGWYITDKIVEPRLNGVEVDADPDEMPKMETIQPNEVRGLIAGLISMVVCALLLVVFTWPVDSPLRAPDGEVTSFAAPLMQMIVPLIFIFFVVPGIVYGYAARTIDGHRDIIKGMSNAMSTMGYYIVMAFFAALFIDAFGKSNVGVLIAVEGANFLRDLAMPSQVTVVGIVFLAAFVNLMVGSASAKWALLAPIFVPMLMQLGISPELTQAAYRVGDSTTNIITPLMPYFPLVVVFCQKYVKNTGIGTVVSMMLPYSVVLLISWTAFLIVYWLVGDATGLPLGIQAPYAYPAP